MADLIFSAVLSSNGSCVTTANDNGSAVLDSRHSSVESSLGSGSEGLQLENTRGSVPKYSLGLSDGLLVGLDTVLANIQAHEAVRDALLVCGVANLRVGSELISGDVVDGENDLDVVGLGLLHDLTDDLATGLVEQTVADLDTLESLLEGECHTTGDDQAVDLGEKVVDQLDLVRDLRASEDSEEGALGRFEGLGEVFEFLLHEETGGLLGEVDTDHGAVGTVGSTESIVCITISYWSISIQIWIKLLLTDVDIAKGSKSLTELSNLLLVGLDLVALFVLGATLLLGVEAQVLKKDDLAARGLVDGLLNVFADRVIGEDDVAAEQFLQLGHNRLQTELGVLVAIGTAEVGHQNNGLSAIVDSILDRGQSTNNTLGVGYRGVVLLVEGYVEVNLQSNRVSVEVNCMLQYQTH